MPQGIFVDVGPVVACSRLIDDLYLRNGAPRVGPTAAPCGQQCEWGASLRTRLKAHADNRQRVGGACCRGFWCRRRQGRRGLPRLVIGLGTIGDAKASRLLWGGLRRLGLGLSCRFSRRCCRGCRCRGWHMSGDVADGSQGHRGGLLGCRGRRRRPEQLRLFIVQLLRRILQNRRMAKLLRENRLHGELDGILDGLTIGPLLLLVLLLVLHVLLLIVLVLLDGLKAGAIARKGPVHKKTVTHPLLEPRADVNALLQQGIVNVPELKADHQGLQLALDSGR
mmetsp:Transcript_101348/g.264747  ORF Transcript_101348/g.264747 Transcript_101348/m.264747 type:complete len:280 (+) Transcript_101348:711-1550(+)